MYVFAAPPLLYMEGATCIAYGFPRPNIVWFNDTTAIMNSSSTVITKEDINMFTISSSLWVTPFLYGKAVLYYCSAVNSEGTSSLLDDVSSCPESKKLICLLKSCNAIIICSGTKCQCLV